MTTSRVLAIALVLMLVGSGIVLLKAEQVRLSYQTAKLDKQALQLRRRLRHQQLEVARLRSPGFLREKTAGTLQPATE